MQIGIIGAGPVALAVARNFLAQGHEVTLSSRRGPSELAETVATLGAGAKAVSVREAQRPRSSSSPSRGQRRGACLRIFRLGTAGFS
jgi:2-polyprenyl-6-methoxyphenol hydroxylase-like FAD-dependent oxidoreductase